MSIKRNKNIGGKDENKKKVCPCRGCLPCGMLTVQGMTLPVEAGEEVKVRSNSQTQMSSDPEAVYVSNYGKSTDQRTINFDSNWKFNLGDVENAQTANFDDSKWRQVSLPHDYSIEQDYSKSMEAESGYPFRGNRMVPEKFYHR